MDLNRRSQSSKSESPDPTYFQSETLRGSFFCVRALLRVLCALLFKFLFSFFSKEPSKKKGESLIGNEYDRSPGLQSAGGVRLLLHLQAEEGLAGRWGWQAD